MLGVKSLQQVAFQRRMQPDRQGLVRQLINQVVPFPLSPAAWDCDIEKVAVNVDWNRREKAPLFWSDLWNSRLQKRSTLQQLVGSGNRLLQQQFKFKALTVRIACAGGRSGQGHRSERARCGLPQLVGGECLPSTCLGSNP